MPGESHTTTRSSKSDSQHNSMICPPFAFQLILLLHSTAGHKNSPETRSVGRQAGGIKTQRPQMALADTNNHNNSSATRKFAELSPVASSIDSL